MTNRIYSLNKQKGFTLVELMVIFGVGMILFGLVGFNMVRFQNTSSQQTSIDMLISDIKSQQFMAMSGATEGRATSDNYGIYFLQDEYVLFHGNVYNPTEPTNFTVELPSDVEIQSTTLPSNNVIFTKISGELSGFSVGNNTITVREKNINKQIVITLNKYGVITSVN
jgi:type II secretory pathway pseudopilin PulG